MATTLTQLRCRSNVLVVQKFTAVQLFVEHGDKLRVSFQSISRHQGALQQATKHIQNLQTSDKDEEILKCEYLCVQEKDGGRD